MFNKTIKYILSGFGIGCLTILLLSFTSSKESKYFKWTKNISLYAMLYKEVNNSYVDDVEPALLMRKGIDAMFKSLDPYTNYISEGQIEGYRIENPGAIGNVGIDLIQQDDYVVVRNVYQDQGGDKAGLKPGDKILSIDGTDAIDRTVDEVQKALQGQPGTEVNLTVQRYASGGAESLQVTRDKTEPTSVPHYDMLDENTAYIKLKGFTRECTKEVKDALLALQKDNEVKGLVFDLRHNGGGLLNEAITMVNLFVPKGELVVSTSGKVEDWKDKKYRTQGDPIAPDLPLVFLVDERSASASEILSGVMQDLDRAVVVGTRSFGKGLVQQTKKLSYNSQMKLTVAKYYLPSGRCVQALDYSGRYKDGTISVPDSLRTAFKTKNNRTVYDGSGVEPDVKVPKAEYANVTNSLIKNHLIFDYVNQFVKNNDTIAHAADFEFSDKDFEDFAQFVAKKEYNYTTESEKVIKRLQKSAKKEKYADAIASTLESLESKVIAEKAKDLSTFKDEIKALLKLEIISRYYYQKGKVVASLDDDPNVKKAIQLLKDEKEYAGILSGTK